MFAPRRMKQRIYSPLKERLKVNSNLISRNVGRKIYHVCAENEHIYTFVKALKKCRKYTFPVLNNKVMHDNIPEGVSISILGSGSYGRE